MRQDNHLTPARQAFLIRALLAIDSEDAYKHVVGKKMSGVYRCCASRIWPMVHFLEAQGLITYEYSPMYTPREMLDVTLTRVGHRIAARCLIWEHRQELLSFPPTLEPYNVIDPQKGCLR
jgi:hypothetical protein